MISHWLGVLEARARADAAADRQAKDLELELQELDAIIGRVRLRLLEIRKPSEEVPAGPSLPWNATREERREFRKLDRIRKVADSRRRALRLQLEQPSLALLFDNPEQLPLC